MMMGLYLGFVGAALHHGLDDADGMDLAEAVHYVSYRNFKFRCIQVLFES